MNSNSKSLIYECQITGLQQNKNMIKKFCRFYSRENLTYSIGKRGNLTYMYRLVRNLSQNLFKFEVFLIVFCCTYDSPKVLSSENQPNIKCVPLFMCNTNVHIVLFLPNQEIKLEDSRSQPKNSCTSNKDLRTSRLV